MLWLDARGLQPAGPWELDEPLCGFLVGSGAGALRARSQAEQLLAGVGRFLPLLKHQLSYAKALLKDWERYAPAFHTVPGPCAVSVCAGSQRGVCGTLG